jgi:putative Mg2+ transporter-C (MgtC) family protein
VINTEETILRIFIATLLAGLVGVERERGARSAGLRTHALVGAGSTLFMLVSAYSFVDPETGRSTDPTRIAAQVVSGIGFLSTVRSAYSAISFAD